MLREPPKAFVRRLKALDADLICLWNQHPRRRNRDKPDLAAGPRFEIGRLTRTAGRLGYVHVMYVEEPKPPYRPRDIFSGEWVIEELRRRDTRRLAPRGHGFDEWYKNAVEGPEHDSKLKKQHEDANEDTQLIRECEDHLVHRTYSASDVKPGLRRNDSTPQSARKKKQ